MFKKIISTIVVIAMVIVVLPTFAMSDINNHWANEEISRWDELGVIRGYYDGTFRPDNHITRAEFATIVNRVLDTDQLSDVTFPDVAPNAWYASEIAKAVAAGFMQGDVGGLMRPNDNVTREEAVVMLYRAVNGGGLQNSQNPIGFVDFNDISLWARDAINTFVNTGIITGFPDDTFRPQNYITRAETIVIIDRIGLDAFSADEPQAEPSDVPDEPDEPDEPIIAPPIGGGGGGGGFGTGALPRPAPIVFELPSEIRITPNGFYSIRIVGLSDDTAVTIDEFVDLESFEPNFPGFGAFMIDEINMRIFFQTAWWLEPDSEHILEFTATRGSETLTRQITVIVEEDEWNWNWFESVQITADVFIDTVFEENVSYEMHFYVIEKSTGQVFEGWGFFVDAYGMQSVIEVQLPAGEYEIVVGALSNRHNVDNTFYGTVWQRSLESYNNDIDATGSVPGMPSSGMGRPFLTESAFEFVPSVSLPNIIITQADIDNFHDIGEPKELSPITLVPRTPSSFSVSGTIIAPSGITGMAYVTLRGRINDWMRFPPSDDFGNHFYTQTVKVTLNGTRGVQYRFDNVPSGTYDIIIDADGLELVSSPVVVSRNRTNRNFTLSRSTEEFGRVAGTISIDRAVIYDISVWIGVSKSDFGYLHWGQELTIPRGQTSVNFHSPRLPSGEYIVSLQSWRPLNFDVEYTVQITDSTVQKDFEIPVGYSISGILENWQPFVSPANPLQIRLFKEDVQVSSINVGIGGSTGWRPPPQFAGRYAFIGLESGIYTIQIVSQTREAIPTPPFSIVTSTVLTEREIVVDDADVSGVDFDLSDIE